MWLPAAKVTNTFGLVKHWYESDAAFKPQQAAPPAQSLQRQGAQPADRTRQSAPGIGKRADARLPAGTAPCLRNCRRTAA